MDKRSLMGREPSTWTMLLSRLRRNLLHGASAKVGADFSPRMIWLHYAIALAAIIITGRIHDKRLDEQDDLDAHGYLNERGRRD
jgi:hypothetical protein